MKLKLIISILVITIFALNVGIVAAKANFSGLWAIDKDKSEGLPPGMTQTMTVTQNGDRIEVEVKIKAGEGEERTIKDVYVLDGKETDFSPPIIGEGATVKRAKRTSKWTADGNGFEVTEEATINGPNGEGTIKARRLWSVSADGKTLNVELDMEGPNGGSKTKRVFVKK